MFSCYDADIAPDRKDGFRYRISSDWNYCSKCGTLLDLDEWKRKEPLAAGVGEEELIFSE